MTMMKTNHASSMLTIVAKMGEKTANPAQPNCNPMSFQPFSILTSVTTNAGFQQDHFYIERNGLTGGNSRVP